MIKPFFTEADCDVRADLYYNIDFREKAGRTQTTCISLDTANRLLEERGKVVYASGDEKYWQDKKDAHLRIRVNQDGLLVDSTHQALLINIEPIEQDSAEKILRDWVDECKKYQVSSELIERAKKLLGDEKLT